LTSPLSGTIIESHILQGQYVEAKRVTFLVADLDHLWIELSVFERRLPAVKVGDLVELRTNDADSAAIANGRVAQVPAVLDADTRGATVRVLVDNSKRKFRPGQSVSAVIHATAAAIENAITVPSRAVIYVDGKPSVFVADSDTSAILTPVELGESNEQEVRIKVGVSPKQRVFVNGASELRNRLFR
jgi:cobalt-zinc-cadmium efflux system membrane fusion protein